MILTIAATILVLGVLIFVHELGHFVAAKSVGISVPRFSIGLGPRLVGFRRGETEYVLSWIPLGGYVKMAGMADEEVTSKLEGGGDTASGGGATAGAGGGTREPGPGDFDGKSLPARVMVISAGVIMNFAFALIAFAAIAMGRGVHEARIISVDAGSPAEVAGIQVDDLITSVDGRRVAEPRQVTIQIERSPDQELGITVDRNGTEVALLVTPRAEEIYNEIAGETRTVGRIGIGFGVDGGRAGVLAAIGQGWTSTVYWSGAIVQFLADLVTGRSSFREVGGPVMIGEISGQAARAGIWELLGFMAIISVNLAIFNLLPIPVLDGGHLLLLGIEAVRGRALGIESRVRFTTVGMAVVMVLMLWAVGNDLFRVITR